MVLALRVESIDAIPETLRTEYETDGQGGFRLITDPPLGTVEEVNGLKSALDKERGARRQSEVQLSEVKATFDGIDPAQVKEMETQLASYSDKQVLDDEGVEALINRRTTTLKEDHQRELNAMVSQLTSAQSDAQLADSRWREDRVRQVITEALVGTPGFKRQALRDALRDGIADGWDIHQEDGRPIRRLGDEVVVGKDGVNRQTPAEWAEMKRREDESSHWWEVSSGGGAGHQQSGTRSGVDWAALPPEQRLNLLRQGDQRTRTG